MSATVTSALRAYIAANWSHCAIAEPNGAADQPLDNGPFLTVRFPVRREDRMSFGAPGDDVHIESGGCEVILSLPLGTALNDVSAPWETRLDTLRAALRNKQDIGGVVTFEVSPVDVDDNGDEDVSHMTLSFVCEYSFEYHA